MVEVLRGLLQIAIEDDHVVAAGGHARQNIEGTPGDQACAVGGQSRCGEVAARMPQELGLGVNRRQDAIGGHTIEDPQP